MCTYIYFEPIEFRDRFNFLVEIRASLNIRRKLVHVLIIYLFSVNKPTQYAIWSSR